MNITLYTKATARNARRRNANWTNEAFRIRLSTLRPTHVFPDRLRNEGWRQMPVIIADDESWSGYRPDKIHELEARCR